MKSIKAKEVYTGLTRLNNAVINYEGDKIVSVEANAFGESEVVGNEIIIPGFIDNHNHGGYGIDFMRASEEDYKKALSRFPEEGITSVVPTIGSISKEEIFNFIEIFKKLSIHTGLTKTLGFHLEGPFLNPKRAGLINPEAMLLPDIELIKEILDNSEGLLKIMTIAPEMEGALDIIELLINSSVIVSAGHSDANQDEMNLAIEKGLNQVTHLFNGMRPLHHREPGILGVGLNNQNIYAETVGFDTTSILPSIWKMMYQLKGPNRMILSTDANILKGLPDGKYEHNGREIIFKDNSIYTEYEGSNKHPGSPMTFINSVKNVLKYTGATLEDIVIMASMNPAKQLGIFDSVGTLSKGKKADFLVLNSHYDIRETYIDGNKVYYNEQ